MEVEKNHESDSTAESQTCIEDCAYHIVNGNKFCGPRWLSPKTIQDILNYVPHDDDIIIASYPKTGSTWLQYIVLQIISRGEWFPKFDDVTNKIAPFMEKTGVKVVEELKEPRIYKHHFPYNMVKKNDKAKWIYIYRKPEDTCQSYYQFLRNMRPDDTSNYSQFFEDFLSGNIAYGRYFEHVLSYLKHSEESNLLMVSYEKLQVNRKEEILRIAKFMGEEYCQDILKDESVLEKIIEKTSFEYMKKNLYFSLTERGNASKQVQFFRKGIVGDGKKSLSSDQLRQLTETVMKTMKETELIDEWLGDIL